MVATANYVPREKLPDRRHVWRQKATITNTEDGTNHTFYIDFGEYPDGRLAEVFVTSHRFGTFTRGVLDTLGRSMSVALQTGTAPQDLAATMVGQSFPPCGTVVADGSSIKECTSIADYIGREIAATYGEDGKLRTPATQPVATPAQELQDKPTRQLATGLGV